jgi:hypothetical protein
MEFLDIIKCHFFCFPAMVAAEKMKEESSAIVTTESLAAVKAFCSSSLSHFTHLYLKVHFINRISNSLFYSLVWQSLGDFID